MSALCPDLIDIVGICFLNVTALQLDLLKNQRLISNAFFHDLELQTLCVSKNASDFTDSFNCDCNTRLFSVVDDIFCLFQGHIENIAPLKQQYGLTKTANEVSVVIEAYRTLRDRGPYPANHVVRDINGKFAFILYDNTSKSVFAAVVSFSTKYIIFF